MAVDVRYPDLTSRTIQRLRDHGAVDPQVFLNGRGIPRLDTSWYDMVHEGEPPATWTHSRNLFDYDQAYREVIRQALDGGLSNILICEDDISLDPSFDALVSRAQIPDDWKILNYGPMLYWVAEDPPAVAPYVRRLDSMCRAAHAVGWRPEAMQTFLARPQDKPIDHIIAGLSDAVPCYGIVPAIVRQRVGVTSVVTPGQEPFSASFLYETRNQPVTRQN